MSSNQDIPRAYKKPKYGYERYDKPKNNGLCSSDTRCCVFILCMITLTVSVAFIIAGTQVLEDIPWYVWFGCVSGAAGGFFGLLGTLCGQITMVFLFLLWSIIITIWWLVFAIMDGIKMGNNANSKHVFQFIYQAALFFYQLVCTYCINVYYNNDLRQHYHQSWWLWSKKNHPGLLQNQAILNDSASKISIKNDNSNDKYIQPTI